MLYDINTWEMTEKDKETHGLWALNTIFAIPAWSPLYLQEFLSDCGWGFYYAADTIGFPLSRGWAMRTYKGFVYGSVLPAGKGQEKEREERFRRVLAPWVEDPWGMWTKYRDDFRAVGDRYMAMNVEAMNNGELGHHLFDLRGLLLRLWEDHMYTTGCLMAIHQTCHQLLTELTGIKVTDPIFSAAMAGFDNSLLDISRGLAKLVRRTFELKIEDNWKYSDEQVLTAMQQTDNGRKWLDEFGQFLKVYGLKSGRIWEFSEPLWMEKPSLVLPEMRPFIESRGASILDERRKAVIKAREEAEKEILAKTPESQKKSFGKLLKGAQACCRYLEDHNWWYEFRTNGLFRRAALELGKRLTKAGALDQPEDFVCVPFEYLIKSCVAQEYASLKEIARANRKDWNKALATPAPSDEIPMIIGDVSLLAKFVQWDPIFSESYAPRVADPEQVGALCVGGAGAPGISEGTARVITSRDQWHLLQPGDIMVAPSTDSTWASVFSLLKGVVTDGGGGLSHPAIICREYGIPCVTGTMDATRKIKSGDKIRVDGDLLRVYLVR